MAGRKSTTTMNLIIGATIIAAIILLIVMLVAWGNTSVLGRHYRVVVNMENVGGLKEGAPVKMGGFQIGRVSTIQIRQGGTDMEIVLDIDENRILPKGSTAKVSTAGLVGDAFLEIIPGKSQETIRRATTVADAERLESSPTPDIGLMMSKVNVFGDELVSLVKYLNDIAGDDQFRRSVKELAVNVNAVAVQANLVLQRGQKVVDNVEEATQNIVGLTATAKDSLEKVTAHIEDITGTVKEIAEKAKGVMGNLDNTIADVRKSVDEITHDAARAMENVNGAITDVRGAVGRTIGNPEVAANLNSAISNVTTLTSTFAQRQGDIAKLLDNLGALSGDLRDVGGRVREVTDRIQPNMVSDAVANLSGAIGKMSGAIGSMIEVVDKVKAEPVLALSVNKAADRIVKMKFDEMSRMPQYRSADATLDEINRWVRDAMRRGAFQDPAYSYEQRPYIINR